MTEYKLPRTESGEADWSKVCRQILWPHDECSEVPRGTQIVDILKAIDANARAEERTRNLGIVQIELLDRDDMGEPDAVSACCDIIRNMGEE